MTDSCAADPTGQDDGIRLSKRVAALTGCSRADAERIIEGGWVRVAGRVVEEPQFRVRDETVDIDPGATPVSPPPVTILLHKPPGFDAGTGEPVDIKGRGKGIRPALELVNTASRSGTDRSGVALLKKHLARQTLCAPLETGASGLLVFSQDARIVRKLTEDAGFIEQEFTIEVLGMVSPEVLQRLHGGPSPVGRPLPPVRASLSSTSDTGTRLRIAAKGLLPGQIARLCDHAGLHLIGIRRIRIGRVPLGALESGQWRLLMSHERF